MRGEDATPDFMMYSVKGQVELTTGPTTVLLTVAGGAAMAELSAEQCLSLGQALVNRAFHLEPIQRERGAV